MSVPLPTAIYTPYDREREENPGREFTLILTPWTVQNICYELVTNHFISNDPLKLGYHFQQKFSPDKTKSEIFIDIAYNWDGKVIGQRPAVFIQRDSAKSASPIINQTIGMNAAESTKEKMAITYLNLGVACIATNLGFVEELADFVKIPFLNFQEQIWADFRFRRFRLEEVGRPQMYPEAKDHFVVMMTIATVFDERWTVKGDNLKIKSITRTIFDALTGQKFLNQ